MIRNIKLNSGNTIPQVGLGTYDIPRTHTASLVYEAAQAGYRHFDTAVLYGNEAEVGEGIAKWINDGNDRLQVFYTTKLWNSQLGYQNTRKAITSCLEKVKQLGYIDLLLIHLPLPGKEARLGSWKALQEAVDEGTVRNIGVSNYGVKHLQELLTWRDLKYKPAVNQIEISPWCMRQELADWCKGQGIVVEGYAPLTHGYKLTHPPPDIADIAEKYGVSVAQVLIRWSVQKGYVPLPKTKTASRLKQNLDLSFELTPEEVETIGRPDAYEPTDWECTDCP